MASQCITPFNPVPSERQLAWHRLGFYGFIHFTTNTFTDKEWGFGDESPQIFNPTELDARQWARVASEAGMKGLILTCKHHDGFCLWPSAYTEHSVKNSPWKNGKGDVVREVSDACREYGLKFGVYLSPWDRNHPAYGKPEYITYYRNQMRELLGNYGSVFEVWLDGANGGDGYYGGANEERRIDRANYYEWNETLKIVRELQPQAVVFSDGGPDIRWVGNESGEAAETNWCTLNAEGRYPGYSPEGYSPKIDLGIGHERGTHWMPAEVDVSIRPGWFYHAHEDGRVRSPLNLLDLYMKSVGRGANLLLNLPPDRRGLIHEKDVESLLAFAKLRDALYVEPVGGFTGFPEGAGDCNQQAQTGNAATINLPVSGSCECNMVIIREAIEYGQRVKEWALELLVDGQWRTVAQGTTIGSQRIMEFPLLKCEGARLRIGNAFAPAIIAEARLYKTPVIAREPIIRRNREGMASIDRGNGAVIRFTINGSEATPNSPVYEKPFMLASGGLIRAAIFQEDNPNALLAERCVIERRYGIAKTGWRIHSCSSEQSGCGEGTARCIDCDDLTLWATDPKMAGHPHFVAIDMGKETEIGAFGYLPRQDGPWGMVNRCSFAVSGDGKEWQTVVREVAFDNIAANPIMQIVALPKAITARYFKFISLGAVNGSPNASAAEFEVFAESK